MAKKRKRRRRTTSEKVMLVLGILIAASMILALIVGLGSGGSTQGQAPLPTTWEDYDSGFDVTEEDGLSNYVGVGGAGSGGQPLTEQPMPPGPGQ